MSRDDFEAWFKSSFHPDKTGPYVKDQLFSAWQAATASLQAERDQLAAECAALKLKSREVLKEAAYVYSHYNRMVEHLEGESIDGQTLHELQELIEAETPATDRFLADQRAVGVEMLVDHLSGMRISASETSVREFAAQLRNEVKG